MSSKEIINTFLKGSHSATEIKDALFHAAEAAQKEGWTFMETSFQLGVKAKEEGLSSEDTEAIIRRAFSAEKRTREREEENTNPGSATANNGSGNLAQTSVGITAPAGAVILDPRFAMMGLDTESLTLLQNHRIDPEALNIPWPSADWRKDLAKLLEAVFLPNETISFKMSNTPDVTTEKVSVITSQTDAIRKIMKNLDGPEGALLCINAVAHEGKEDTESWRYRYVVIDNPKMTLAKQLAYYKALNLPCAALVNTGAGSVQAWVRIEANDIEEYTERVDFLFKVLEDQGFKVDSANKRADTMVRMPGVLRNGKQQYLIALSQGAKNFPEWKEWVEFSLDGNPLVELASDCVESPKQEEPILDGALRAGELLVLSAPPKSGKSFALLDFALSVCYGQPWFCNETKRHDVLFINFESTRSAFLNRLHLLAQKRGLSPTTEHLGFLNLRGTALSPLEMAQFIAKRVQGARKMNNQDYKVIILDPASALWHSPKAIRSTGTPSQIIMQMIDSIIALTGSAVVTAVNQKELSYLEDRADSLISLLPMEGAPNIFQMNASFRDFPKAFTRECSWIYPQFIF